MYSVVMLAGISIFGYWFGFSSSEIAIHSAFAIAGFIVGKL